MRSNIGLAIALAAGLRTVGLTIVWSATPCLKRVVYAGVRAERDKEYIEAAPVLGAGTRTVLFRRMRQRFQQLMAQDFALFFVPAPKAFAGVGSSSFTRTCGTD